MWLTAGASDKWETALLKLKTSWELCKSPVVGKPQGSTLKEKVHKPSRLAGSRQQTKKIQGFHVSAGKAWWMLCLGPEIADLARQLSWG